MHQRSVRACSFTQWGFNPLTLMVVQSHTDCCDLTHKSIKITLYKRDMHPFRLMSAFLPVHRRCLVGLVAALQLFYFNNCEHKNQERQTHVTFGGGEVTGEGSLNVIFQ